MAGAFGRDRIGSRSNIKFQSCGRYRRRIKKRGKSNERVIVVTRKKTTKKKRFLNQKLEQRKHNKGLSLDPPQRNQNQNQNLISRHVEEEKKEASYFHGFHNQHQNQYFQLAQQLHQQQQHHQLLFGFGGGGLDTQSSPKKRSYLPSSSSQTNEYAIASPPKMGDSDTTHHRQTRLGNLRNTVDGEIVEVQGGHIVRSTGRKDRHSKVCTAKGPRDRRVRLSAYTAIQFYDVQDRLGFDRPSKAVDWLIKKAKAAIDELDRLPAWKPTIGSTSTNPTNSEDQNQHQLQQQQLHSIAAGSNSNALRLNDQPQSNENNNSSFMPPSMDSDSIADTIKSLFPMGASTETNSSASAANNIQFPHNFPTPDLLSRRSSQSQDLRLSLQSFRDPMLIHHNHHQNQHHHHNEESRAIFSGAPFDGSEWSENQPGEIGRFQRMVSWNAGGDNGPSGGGGAYVFNSPPPMAQPMLQPLFGQNHQLFSQRGPLQSSNTPSVRAWIDPSVSAFSAANDHHQASLPFHLSSVSGIGFDSGGGFSGFRIPARIQGEEEEQDGISDKPSSASSDSRH